MVFESKFLIEIHGDIYGRIEIMSWAGSSRTVISTWHLELRCLPRLAQAGLGRLSSGAGGTHPQAGLEGFSLVCGIEQVMNQDL